MTRIKTIPIEDAEGAIKKIYDDGLKRAGRVSQIVQSMSLNVLVLRTSMMLYTSIMMGESPLSRIQRELLGTVVAAKLKCKY